MADPDQLRREMLDRWERSAAGWGRRAGRLREQSMPISMWMVEHAGLEPGQRVLELAAGPGDTGFLAAERIRPGGTLISSDGTEAMLEVARARARELGIENVEFKQLQLEWIDLETASVDVIICRWALMLIVDPDAALHEMRRVLKPGGRIVLAVWDRPELNPWATITDQAMVELGHEQPPDPTAPGMFVLSAPGRLQAMLESAGFVDPVVESLELAREPVTAEGALAERAELSQMFASTLDAMTDAQRAEVRDRIASLAEPYAGADGLLRLPGRTLGAAADA